MKLGGQLREKALLIKRIKAQIGIKDHPLNKTHFTNSQGREVKMLAISVICLVFLGKIIQNKKNLRKKVIKCRKNQN